MKLSSKGLTRLGLYESMGFSLGSYEFKQEDSKDTILLSLSDAKALQEILEYVYYNCSDPELESKSLSLFRYIKSTIKLIDHV